MLGSTHLGLPVNRLVEVIGAVALTNYDVFLLHDPISEAHSFQFSMYSKESIS